MTPYFTSKGISIYHGDCVKVLDSFEADRFATCLTDPPYHLTTNKSGGTGIASLNPNSPAGRSRIGTGFMGKAWDGGDVAFRPETWAAVLRVCKPGAMLFAFGGTRTFHRLTCAIEDAGWEIRDCMSWLYGSGFPKSLDISKTIDKAAGAEREVIGRKTGRAATPINDIRGGSFNDSEERRIDCSAITAPATENAKTWSGYGTALKPAWEPIVVAMKPVDDTFAANALAHGVSGLNIDGGRIPLNGDYKCKPNGRPSQTGLGDNYDPKAANQPDTIGRWPANVLLDEDAATMLDEYTGNVSGGDTRIGGQGSRPGSFFAPGSPIGDGKPCGPLYGDSGGASRFFYTAKASRADRGHGNDHATVKPSELMKYLAKLSKMPGDGGEIIDPFGGSMTTLVAAREVGRPAVAIDIEEKHCIIGASRLAQEILF